MYSELGIIDDHYAKWQGSRKNTSLIRKTYSDAVFVYFKRVNMINNKAFFILCACWLLNLSLSVSHASCHKELPYDASKDPNQEIQQAVKALGQRELILLSFGANWCKDCRVFNKALCKDPLKHSIQNQAVIVKIDIGQWDHNLKIVERFGNPIEKGIPAVVIIDQQQRVLAAATGGELAKARSLSEQDISTYLNTLLNNAHKQAKALK
jgi:thioredoxin 1